MIDAKTKKEWADATKARLDAASCDPSFQKEFDELLAQQAAQEVIESMTKSRSFLRKLEAFRERYHRDINLTVGLGELAFG